MGGGGDPISSRPQAAKAPLYIITPTPAQYPEVRKEQRISSSSTPSLEGEGFTLLVFPPPPKVPGERGCGGNSRSPRTLRLWRMWRKKALTWLTAVFSLRCYQPWYGSLALCLAHLSRPSCNTYSSLRPRPGPAQSPAQDPAHRRGGAHVRPSPARPRGERARRRLRAPPHGCSRCSAVRRRRGEGRGCFCQGPCLTLCSLRGLRTCTT